MAESLSLVELRSSVAVHPSRNLILLLLFLGFGIKAGSLPLHVWLPLAHPAAPTPASRCAEWLYDQSRSVGLDSTFAFGGGFSSWMGYGFRRYGLIGAFYGVAMGILQKDPKTVLAYSSISQMGLVSVLLGAALIMPERWPTASVAIALYATHHALTKGALFLSVGIERKSHERKRRSILIGLGCGLPALSLVGFPGTSGQVAKRVLKYVVNRGMLEDFNFLQGLLHLAPLGTALIMARFLWLLWGKAGGPTDRRSARINVPWALSVIAMLLLPFYWTHEGYNLHGTGSFSAAASWQGMWPVLVGLLLVWLAAKHGWNFPFRLMSGDVLGVYMALLRVCRTILPGRFVSLINRRQSHSHAICSDLISKSMLIGRLERLEKSLADWNLIGVLFLLLLAVTVFVLML